MNDREKIAAALEAAYKAFDDEPRTAYDGYKAALMGGLQAAITAYLAEATKGDVAELVGRLRRHGGGMKNIYKEASEAATMLEAMAAKDGEARADDALQDGDL